MYVTRYSALMSNGNLFFLILLTVCFSAKISVLCELPVCHISKKVLILTNYMLCYIISFKYLSVKVGHINVALSCQVILPQDLLLCLILTSLHQKLW